MLKIAHRVNTVEQLQATPKHYGVEMDLHGYGDRIVVHHDARTDAIDFERWLEAYDHAFVILNVKEEGIESRVRELVLARGIHSFFMLDLSFPALMKQSRAGEHRLAVRVSEYEPVEGALRLAGMADWVWLDQFKRFPIDRGDYDLLKAAGFRVCLVSPELQGRDAAEIGPQAAWLAAEGIVLDAVCTKRAELW